MPQTVKICSVGSSNSNMSQSNNRGIYCPYDLLRPYLKQRPKYVRDKEQFFVFQDRTPVKTTQVSRLLNELMTSGGFDNTKYSFHGLRAGRGVNLLRLGVSVETIKKLGHWKTNGVFSYLNKFN